MKSARPGSATFLRCAAVVALAAGSIHCASATPVAPAPVAPDEAPKLEAALMGSCHVTGTQKPGGEIKEAKGVHFTFAPGGKLHYHVVAGFATVDNDYAYHLEGRNVVSDGLYKNMRVDDFNGNKLTLFIYDITETYYCTKE